MLESPLKSGNAWLRPDGDGRVRRTVQSPRGAREEARYESCGKILWPEDARQPFRWNQHIGQE